MNFGVWAPLTLFIVQASTRQHWLRPDGPGLSIVRAF